jgi:hypothetical protein
MTCEGGALLLFADRRHIGVVFLTQPRVELLKFGENGGSGKELDGGELLLEYVRLDVTASFSKGDTDDEAF